MTDCSIVTAAYSTKGGQQGTIGVIGPTRMQYSRVLSILNVIGHQLTDMFNGDDDTK
jgi:heat-inducible transcriptional repressor